MICQHCFKEIGEEATTCPVCGRKLAFVVGDCPVEALNVMRDRFFENDPFVRTEVLESLRKRIRSLAKGGWNCLSGDMGGLFKRCAPFSENFYNLEFTIYPAGGMYVSENLLCVPVIEGLDGTKNGVKLFSVSKLASSDEPDGLFVPLDGKPIPSAVIMGDYFAIVVKTYDMRGACWRVAVIDLSAPAPEQSVTYLEADGGEMRRSLANERSPKLIADHKNGLLFVATESMTLGFVCVPTAKRFKYSGALSGSYRRGLYSMREVVLGNDRLFFSLYRNGTTMRSNLAKRAVMEAKIIRAENGEFVLSFNETLISYELPHDLQSVLKIFVRGDELCWLSLENTDDESRSYASGSAKTSIYMYSLDLADMGAYVKRTRVANCSKMNSVDAVEYDGKNLTVFGHDSNNSNFFVIKAKGDADGFEEIEPEKSQSKDKAPFLLVEEANVVRGKEIKEYFACPRCVKTLGMHAVLTHSNVRIKQ